MLKGTWEVANCFPPTQICLLYPFFKREQTHFSPSLLIYPQFPSSSNVLNLQVSPVSPLLR